MKKYNVFAVSVCGNYRENNQDNLFLNGYYRKDVGKRDFTYMFQTNENRRFLAAVFDGIGGLQKGDAASLAACRSTDEDFSTEQLDMDRIVLDANRAVCDLNAHDGIISGSTCVYLEHDRGMFRSWNLGDSRAYWLHGDMLRQLSRDHTEGERIKGIFGSDCSVSRGSLTQYLGIEDEEFIVEPFVSEWINAESGDQFVLCSDGLSGVVSDDEIRSVLINRGPIQDRMLELLKKTADSHGKDNITVIIIDIFNIR